MAIGTPPRMTYHECMEYAENKTTSAPAPLISKHYNTRRGKCYAITPTEICTVTTMDGIVLATCEPGRQTIIVAPDDRGIFISANNALFTDSFSPAPCSIGAGGVTKKQLETALSAKADAAALTSKVNTTTFTDHANDATHITAEERTAWNAKASPGVLPVVNALPADLALLPGHVYCLALRPNEAYDWSGLTIARDGEAVPFGSDFLTVELSILANMYNEITWPADMVWLEGAAPTLQSQFCHQIVLRHDGFKLIGNVAYVYELA